MLARLLGWAEAAGIVAIHLTTFAAFEPSRRPYRRAGFRVLAPVETPPALAHLLRGEREAGLGERLALVRDVKAGC